MNKLSRTSSSIVHSSKENNSKSIEGTSSQDAIEVISQKLLTSPTEVENATSKPLDERAVPSSKFKEKLRGITKRIGNSLKIFFKKVKNSLTSSRFSYKIQITNTTMEIHTNNRPIGQKQFMGVFKSITDQFHADMNIKIIAKNNPAVDDGGPKREFFSTLAAMALKERPLSNLFSAETSGAVLIKEPSTANEHEALRRLGKMLGICLKFDIQIGHIIDRSTFTVISKLMKNLQNYGEDIDLEDERNFNEFFSLYKLLQSDQEQQKQTIEQLENALGSKETEEEAKDAIKVAIKNKVIPLIELSKGMTEALPKKNKDLIAESPEYLAEQLLGLHLDGEELLEHIEFDEHLDPISDDVKEWIKNWIKRRSPEEVNAFLYAMTGSPTIGPTIKIQFSQTTQLQQHEHKPLYEINTCYRLLWMDYAQVDSEEVMHEILDSILSTSGFNAK